MPPPAVNRTHEGDHPKDADDDVSSMALDNTPVEKIRLSGMIEKKATRLSRAREPMREGDMNDEYITIIIKPIAGILQATRLFEGVCWGLTAIQ